MQRLPNLIERPKDILQIVSWTHILPILFAALILTPLTSPALPAQAKAEKVAICHVDDEGSYKLIHVAAKAVDAHMGHGDARPSDPGFDENCAEVPVLSPGCQAANLAPFSSTNTTWRTGLNLFYAGETITINVSNSLSTFFDISLFNNALIVRRTWSATPFEFSYTLSAADVSSLVDIGVSQNRINTMIISVRCE